MIGQFGEQIVHCFIDFSGHVYKTVTPKVSSKKPYGSIFDENYGIGTIVDANGVIRHENR